MKVGKREVSVTIINTENKSEVIEVLAEMIKSYLSCTEKETLPPTTAKRLKVDSSCNLSTKL